MICDNCKSSNSLVKNHEHVYIVKGKEIKFIAKRRFCKECNNLVYDSELDNKASEIAISIYNEKYGITKDQIKSLRSSYNLSLDLFAKIIGCAKKTLISYEKGTSIPNDSYLIIIKSLLSKPETIFTLIDVNKNHFTNKEYDKINNKLSSFMPNNTKSLMFNIDSIPSEYNGYTKFSKEKLYNMILFFADKSILKTKLLKEMFYSDFINYKNTCKSITGLEYSKLTYGPVPDQFENILNKAYNDQIIDYDIAFYEGLEYCNIISLKEFDKSLFTKEELDVMKNVRKKFIDFSSKAIADFSHKENAFTKTNYYKKISYEYAFDINIE